MHTLKHLFLSLLNATLMLAVILVVLTLLLAARVGQLADTTTVAAQRALQGPNAKLEQIALRLADIEVAVKSGALDGAGVQDVTEQLKLLNSQVQDIRASVAQVRDIPMQQIGAKVAEVIAARLARPSPCAPIAPTGGCL